VLCPVLLWLCCQVELIVGDVKEAVSRVSDVHFIEADNLTVPSITYEVGREGGTREGPVLRLVGRVHVCLCVCVLVGG
jgi:hypothetical protein